MPVVEEQIEGEQELVAIMAQRSPVDSPQPAAAVVGPCRCGHTKDAHEHFRAGGDCGICGPEVCRRFRVAPAERHAPAVTE